LRELSQFHTKIALAELVEISELSGTDGFELKIKCVLDARDRESVNEFLEKKDLKTRETKGVIIVY